MKLLLIAITLLAVSSCFASEASGTNTTVISNSNSTNNSTDPKTEEEGECSYKNLKKVIGHNDYSILGKGSDCNIFYFTGQDVEKPSFNVSSLGAKEEEGCSGAAVPLFYKNTDGKGYRVVVVFQSKIYTFDCVWKRSASEYYSCFLDLKNATQKSLQYPGNSKEAMRIMSSINDPNTEDLHVFYEDDEGGKEGVYSLRELNFTSAGSKTKDFYNPITYDPDLKRLYFKRDDEHAYTNVIEKDGSFAYSEEIKKVSTFPMKVTSKYGSTSFSHEFYILKAKDSRYYVGIANTSVHHCFAAPTDERMLMQLFVKGKDAATSIYTQVHDTIEPQALTTTTAPQPPTTTSACGNLASVFLTFVMFLATVSLQ